LESRYDSVLSAETGAGLDGFVRRLGRWAAEQGGRGDDALFSRDRHRIGLETCLAHLRQALAAGLAMDLQAEELRLAGDALGRLTGRIDVEDLLDTIFREFCIGK
jgi:tRNA modification GTPase